MKISKEVITDGCNYRLEAYAPNILSLTYLDGCEIDLDIAKEYVDKGNKLMGGDFYILADFRNSTASFLKMLGIIYLIIPKPLNK